MVELELVCQGRVSLHPAQCTVLPARPAPPAAARSVMPAISFMIFISLPAARTAKLQQKQLREKIATFGRFAKLLFAQSARQPAVNLCFYGAENWNYY